MYNPLSDTQEQRERFAAYILVMKHMVWNGYPGDALSLWNNHFRHSCIPGSMQTVWQLALEHGLANAQSGNEKNLPNLDKVSSAIELAEMLASTLERD